MKKIKSFIEKYKIEILCFIIPIVIFLIAGIFCQFYPFGNKISSTYDGIAQYPGFTLYFSKVLKGQESLFFSFKGGLGFNFYATFIYYLSNPTNLLCIFANENNLILYYLFITLLRIGLSGFTMSLLLKYKNNKSKFRILFSICYALMAYNVLYYYNYMYFDTIVLFPLVIMGLEKLVHERKPKMFFITLSLSIFSNFYIGYMVCIFSLIYFIYLYILLDKEKRNKKIILDFIKYSILSALVNCIILIPVVLEILNGKASMFIDSNGYTKYWEFSKDYINFIYKLTIGSYKNGDMAKTSPNIYSSIFVLVLTVFFFINKKIPKKEKLLCIIIISFFILCFSFNFLDYSWHMFQRPVWYPKRYSFCFSLFIILMAYKCLNNINGLNNISKKKWLIYIALVLSIMASALYNDVLSSSGRIAFLALSLICLTEYFLTLNSSKYHLFIFMIFFIEISGNTIFSLKNISYNREYITFSESTKNTSNSIKYIEAQEEDNSFYRTELSSNLISNNGGMFNYNALKYFNSLRNQKAMLLLKNLDQRIVDGCSVTYYADNPIYNSILGIKYLEGKKSDNLYKKTENPSTMIYKNNYVLALGFASNENILNTKLISNNIIINNNSIINDMLGEQKDYVKVLKYKNVENLMITSGISKDKFDRITNEKGVRIIFEAKYPEDTIIIFPPQSRNTALIDIESENKKVEYSSTNNFAYILRKNKNYIITFTLNVGSGYLEDYYPNTISLKNFNSFIDEMKKNELIITEYKKDNHIKGKVTITEDKNILYTSIPYDEGWRVLVNGKEVKKIMIYDALIGIKLKPGTYEIEFKYIPRGFVLGSIISGMAIILGVILLKKKKTGII